MADENKRAAPCPRCGNAVQEGDRFCGTCGTAILPPAPQAEQVIPRPVAASQAPSRSNKKPLLLAGVAGVLLLLVVGGGAMAFLGSGGEEVKLISGVYAEAPEGWVVPSSEEFRDFPGQTTLVPTEYKTLDVLDPTNEVPRMYFVEPGRPSCQSEPAKIDEQDMPVTSGYSKSLIGSGTLTDGEATVAGHPARWVLGYDASALPWFSPDDPSLTASEYPDYQAGVSLEVCVEDLDLHATFSTGSALVQAPEDEPTAERNASVPEARNEVHEELNRRYEANIGAMTDLLEAVDAEGLFNGGRTDLSAIPTSLDGVDAELSNPFGGPLEGFANTPDPTSSASSDPTASASPDSSASPEPVASASPDSSASPSSEEEILEEFGREYDEASRREDWAKTYSMLDESSHNFTEAEWAEAQRIMREAEGPPPPLESVSVEQNEETSDRPATLTLHYEDGTEDIMIAVVPMVVEDESDSGVPKRVLIGQEIGEIRAVASSGQSIEEMMVEAEEAAGDYYRAAGSEDWAYTYENLDEETQSLFTREEWFQKNQWFADNGEVIYHIESVGMTGTSSESVGVTLTLTYEDGTSSTRNTYFVYEDGVWKHAFGQEEYDLFMPDLSYEEFVQAQQ